MSDPPALQAVFCGLVKFSVRSLEEVNLIHRRHRVPAALMPAWVRQNRHLFRSNRAESRFPAALAIPCSGLFRDESLVRRPEADATQLAI
jgi:hypothetical protein